MPEETPSQWLLRAAAHVYQLGHHYEEHYVRPVLDGTRATDPEEDWVGDVVADDASSQARRWLETINPRLTTALALVLQDKAYEVRDAKTHAETTGPDPVFELAALILLNVLEPKEKPGLPETPSRMPE
jgi:hypothetical protein